MIIYAYNLRHSHFSNHVGIDIPRLTLKERYLIKTWFKAAQLDCFLRFLGNFFKWSAKWCLGTNDEITLDGSGKNRYGQNAPVNSLWLLGKYREELIKSSSGWEDSLWTMSCMKEKREGGFPRYGAWQATGCFSLRAGKQW